MNRYKKFNCIATPEQLEELNGLVALDLDGVIGENYMTRVALPTLGIMDPRLRDFIDNNQDIFTAQEGERRTLSQYDVKGVSVHALLTLVQAARDAKIGFVIVSSWINTKDSCVAIEKLFESICGKTEHKLVVGQTSGTGESDREKDFFAWVNKYGMSLKGKPIAAVDDSGARFFPYLSHIDGLVTPVGRNLFVMDDYIKLLRKVGANSTEWYEWASKGYLDGVETVSDENLVALWNKIELSSLPE